MDRGAWSAPLSMGSQRVRHTEGLSMHTRACGHVHTHTCTHTCIAVLLSNEFVSDYLWPHGLQLSRPPCPLLLPEVCSDSCLLSGWCHPTISSSVIPLLLLPSIFPKIRVFSNGLALCIRWPKYWSFSISPSSDYSGLISFRMDWFALAWPTLMWPFWWRMIEKVFHSTYNISALL